MNLNRCLLLVRKILDENKRNVFPNFSSLQKYILANWQYYSDVELSLKEDYLKGKFDRDKKDIQNFWKVDLEFNGKGYQINKDLATDFIIDDLLISSLMLKSLNKDSLLPNFVIPESRENTGIQYFQDIAFAIENHCEIGITYFKYKDGTEKIYFLKPYKLKQKDFKWYVLAMDTQFSETEFKSFALERIRELKISDKKFKTKNIDFEEPYKDAFAMFTNGNPQKIVLQFDEEDGNYILANPIHHSQKLKKIDNGFEVELFVKPTLDFIKELLSRSWSLKIMEPIDLKEKFLHYWQEAIERNS